MGMNIMEIMQMVGRSGNPQQMVMNLMQGPAQNNPLMANLLNMAKNGNGAGIQEVGRNLWKSQGRDFDKEFGDFLGRFGGGV